MLCLAVTDQELLTGQVVKIIFVSLLLFGTGYNLRQTFRAAGGQRRLTRIGLALFFLLLALPVARWILIEGSILHAPVYVTGTTTGYCQAFARGKAITFEYEVKGRTYRNCNTYHPIPVDSIIVPGGKYYVRLSPKYQDKGRMDFHRKVN